MRADPVWKWVEMSNWAWAMTSCNWRRNALRISRASSLAESNAPNVFARLIVVDSITFEEHCLVRGGLCYLREETAMESKRPSGGGADDKRYEGLEFCGPRVESSFVQYLRDVGREMPPRGLGFWYGFTGSGLERGIGRQGRKCACEVRGVRRVKDARWNARGRSRPSRV
jgi:hypothetical protein